MKVRFYCDVPEWHNGIMLYACQNQPTTPPLYSHKRVAFDVSFPDGVLKRGDLGAVAVFVGEVADPNIALEDEGGAP